MTVSAVPKNQPRQHLTRQRLLDAAVRLFGRHSFAGTSLQMIADELSITKAAVYHHFHTREELLFAVLEPALNQIRTVVQTAETKRTPHARAEHVLTGYAALAVEHRAVAAVLATDAGVIEVLRSQTETRELIERQLGLLAEVSPGPAGQINAAMVLAGIAVAAGQEAVELDDDALRACITEAGRRALGLRTPRRPPREPASGRPTPATPAASRR